MNVIDRLNIDLYSEATLTQQIKERFVWLIASGDLKPGDLLPPLRQVSEQLSININTVRSAYQKLEAEGFVETRQGSGSRVLRPDPNRFARLRKDARTDTIGVIIPTMSNPFYQDMVAGIEQELHIQRSLLFVCNTHDNPDDALRYYLQLAAKQVDGIIVSAHNPSRFSPTGSNAPGAAGSHLPLVSVDWPGYLGYSVLLDLESAGYQATRHLLDHGHQRIGLITYITDANNIHPVNKGYERALQEEGIDLDPNLIVHVYGFGMPEGEEAARSLIALEQPPTALFAITDLLAIGAMNAVQQSGLRVPEDIALVGFNDIPLAKLVNPALTTVSAPGFQLGQEAVRMLQALIAGEQPLKQQLTLPNDLMIRHSCGC